LTKEQPNLEQGKTLTILANKALIYEDFKNQKRPFRLFSNLFRNYIVRQSISNKLNNDALFNTILDSLAPLDRKLLVHLQSHSEKILSFEDLKSVWDDPSKVEKPTIEAALHRIRTVIAEKSGSKEKYLKNVRGKGYQFIP
jgi:DNA-binding response OmpR family regulator